MFNVLEFVMSVSAFRGLQVCIRALEKETVGRDELLAEGAVLGVPSASVHCSCYSSNTH